MQMGERQSEPQACVLHPPLILGSICGKFQHHPNHQRCPIIIEKALRWQDQTGLGHDLGHGLDSISLNWVLFWM